VPRRNAGLFIVAQPVETLTRFVGRALDDSGAVVDRRRVFYFAQVIVLRIIAKYLSDFDENVEVWILRKGADELLVDVGDAVEEKALAKAAQDGNVALTIFATHFVTLLRRAILFTV